MSFERNTIKKTALLIFLLSLIVRLFYVVFGCFDQPLTGDAVEYNLMAVNFLHGQGLQANNFWSFLPPLNSLFIAGSYVLCGESPNHVRILQAILSSGSCVLIFLLAWRLANGKVAVLAGLISCVYPGLIKYTGELLSETLFIFLFLAAVLFIQRDWQTRTKRDQVLAGIFLGLATLTRGVSLMFPLLVFAFSFIADHDFKRNLRSFAVLIVVFILTLLPWTMRNYARYHQLVLLDTHGGKVLVDSNNPLAQGQWTPGWIEQFHPEIKRLDEVTANKAYMVLARDYIIQAGPWRLLKLAILKMLYFLYPFLPQYDILFVLLFPFFLAGMYVAGKQRQYLLLAVVLNYLLITLIFFGAPRIRDTAMPFIIILAGMAIVPAWEKIRQNKLPAVMMTLWLILNIVINFYADPIRFVIKSWKGG